MMALSRHLADWDCHGTPTYGNNGSRSHGFGRDYWLHNEATNVVPANEGASLSCQGLGRLRVQGVYSHFSADQLWSSLLENEEAISQSQQPDLDEGSWQSHKSLHSRSRTLFRGPKPTETVDGVAQSRAQEKYYSVSMERAF